MFSWARKQRLSQRKSISKSEKSSPQTNLHSNTSTLERYNKSLSTLNSDEEMPFATPNKQQHKQSTRIGTIFTMSKGDLMTMVSTKNKGKQTSESVLPVKTSQKQTKVIRIKIQVNRLLDEYCRAVKQILVCHIWGIFGVALVLFKLGFTRDLVDDRDTARQVWQTLNHPDQFSLYVFLEQVLSNRIHLQKAISSMQAHLNIKIDEGIKQNAIQIMSMKKSSDLFNLLRINRMTRTRLSFGLPN